MLVRSEGAAVSYDTEANIHAKVDVVFSLPDGTQFRKVGLFRALMAASAQRGGQTFSAGDTLAQVKKQFADAKGLRYADIKLSLDGKARRRRLRPCLQLMQGCFRP